MLGPRSRIITAPRRCYILGGIAIGSTCFRVCDHVHWAKTLYSRCSETLSTIKNRLGHSRKGNVCAYHLVPSQVLKGMVRCLIHASPLRPPQALTFARWHTSSHTSGISITRAASPLVDFSSQRRHRNQWSSCHRGGTNANVCMYVRPTSINTI